MTTSAVVIGLIIWLRIDDQRQRSFVTGRPGAAFTANQLVTERDWLGWPGGRLFRADRRIFAVPSRAICAWARIQIIQFCAPAPQLVEGCSEAICSVMSAASVGPGPSSGSSHGWPGAARTWPPALVSRSASPAGGLRRRFLPLVFWPAAARAATRAASCGSSATGARHADSPAYSSSASSRAGSRPSVDADGGSCKPVTGLRRVPCPASTSGSQPAPPRRSPGRWSTRTPPPRPAPTPASPASARSRALARISQPGPQHLTQRRRHPPARRRARRAQMAAGNLEQR
jgi:hypothetical protein